MWRSWNEAKYLLKEGCVWKVGNENRINIWEDSWLNDEKRRKIITPKLMGCTVQRVKELLNQGGVGWNMEMLARLFSDDEILAIKRTPISTMGLADRLVWASTNNGQYSVKSGYKVAKSYERKMKGDEGGSNRKDEEESNLWKGLWNLDIKRKVKFFIWKACHNRLPVGDSLKRRGIHIDETCKLYGEEKETVEHLFFKCRKAEMIWKLAPVS